MIATIWHIIFTFVLCCGVVLAAGQLFFGWQLPL